MSIKDPCVSVCRFDGKTGWCKGCGRTTLEIRAWRKMQPHARSVVERDLPRRMKRIVNRQGKRTEPDGTGLADPLAGRSPSGRTS